MKKYLPMLILIIFGILFIVGFIILITNSKSDKSVDTAVSDITNNQQQVPDNNPKNYFDTSKDNQDFIEQAPRDEISGYGITDSGNDTVNVNGTISEISGDNWVVLIPNEGIDVTIQMTSGTYFQSRPKIFKAYETNREMLAQTLPMDQGLFKKGDVVEIIGKLVGKNQVSADFINLLLDK
jgi:hypothetical protein